MADEAIPASTDPVESQAQETQEAPSPAESLKEEAAQVPNYRGTKHKIKIDDIEEEVEYEELLKGYQKTKAGDKKLRQAAEIREKVEQIIENLKSGNHKNLVNLLGKEPAKKMAEALLLEELEYEELPEHEKRIRTLERENKEKEEKLQEQETQRQTLERKKAEAEAGQQIESEMIKAVQDAKIKATPRLFARMAEVMEAYAHKTKRMLPAKDALKFVRSEIPRDFSAFVESLSIDDIRALKKDLPKNFLDALRQDDVDSVLSQTSVSKGRTSEPNPSGKKKSRESDRRMTTDEWFAKMEQRLA